jgi:hypothetical protein
MKGNRTVRSTSNAIGWAKGEQLSASRIIHRTKSMTVMFLNVDRTGRAV